MLELTRLVLAISLALPTGEPPIPGATTPAPVVEIAPSVTPTPAVAIGNVPAPTATPTAPPPHRRQRSTLEHRKLQFLVGDWEVAGEVRDGVGAAPQAVSGSLSVRYDLGGLLLIERWTLAGTPDAYEARLIWYLDEKTKAFRVFRFDSGGAAGDEFHASAGEGVLSLERRFESDGKTRIERRVYTKDDPMAKGQAPRRVILVVSEGDDAAAEKTFTATLIRSLR